MVQESTEYGQYSVPYMLRYQSTFSWQKQNCTKSGIVNKAKNIIHPTTI